MKAELALLSLILVVSCSALSYDLKCTEKEKDILWPVYSNDAVYMRCAEIGKPLEMKCNAGTLFSFVYQSCVLPDDYIPPPPKDSLPLDVGAPPQDTSTKPTSKPPIILPTPQHPPPAPITEKPTPKPTPEPTPKPTKPTKTTPTESASTVTPPRPPTGSPAGPPTGSPPAPPTGGPPGPPTPARPTAGPGVPGPPSPPATGVPMPNTPAPTPPVIDNTPPSAGVTLPSKSET